ncbi:metallophosphoesterase family protein [Paenibacillus lutrae]|uniref:Metallophosphoesterase n=1 Tax=Paenibacillus lutrae TaxID=2078573 RepID=A0A7X3FKL5_9BACL|nr:metallophosphoesterase [Paenibacillus lutrae]MVP01365.1 metallophosphoesterase [Paenibacillus lutrae]
MKKKASLSLLMSASLLLLTTVPASAKQEMIEEPKLSFPVISDIHVSVDHPESQSKFKAAVEDLYRIDPDADALVINGDLTNGTARDYKLLSEIWKQVPLPPRTFANIGNHEFYSSWLNKDGDWSPDSFPNKVSDSDSIQSFLKFAGEQKVYREEMVGGYPFLFLGSEKYRQSDPSIEEDAYLSDEQLDWLKDRLARHGESAKPIFVFLHQPLPDTVAGSSVKSNQRAVVQHKELKSILSEYPEVIFFTGHSHWELNQPNTLVTDGFTMVNSSSVERPWSSDGNGGEKQLGEEESEGLYVEVYEDSVSIKGRDFKEKKWITEAQYTVPIRR